jgi:hypothetical protein
MAAVSIDTWKEGFGFNVTTSSEPDLLNWILENWIKSDSPNEVQVESVKGFLKFGQAHMTKHPVIGMEYLDQGIGILLSTGERLPFNKSLTITEPTASVSITGSYADIQNNSIRQMDTSASITGRA